MRSPTVSSRPTATARRSTSALTPTPAADTFNEPTSARSSVNNLPARCSSLGESLGDNVRVIVRTRPLNAREIEAGGRTCLALDTVNHRVTLDTKPEPAVFTYDRVAGPAVDQDEFFQLAGKPIVDACMSGFNATIFAYGQTGSGKTYTMLGPVDEDARQEGPDGRGIIPRTLEYLFQTIAAEPDDGVPREVACRVSFLEIYNETLTDLLDPAGSAGRLHLREDAKAGVTCENLRVEPVRTVREAMALMHRGAANRRVCATALNHESSRSHTVFTVAIEQRLAERGGEVLRRTYLNLIDLAGSERHTAALAAAQQLRETSNINRSLSTLGHVIRALGAMAHGRRPAHVRYRDSKLTFLLKDSLGGNSKTSVIANVSPSLACFKETLLTLHFARRMKLVRNRAVVNEELSAGAAVAALHAELDRLQRHVKLLEHELFFERVRHRADEGAAGGRALSTREDALADTNFWLDEPEAGRRGEEAAEYGRLLGEHRALQEELDAVREVQYNRELVAAEEATLLNEAQEVICELDGTMEEANARLAEQARLIALLTRSLHACSCAPPEAKAALAALAERPEVAALLGHGAGSASGRTSPAGHLLTPGEARTRFQANLRSKLGARLASPSKAPAARASAGSPGAWAEGRPPSGHTTPPALPLRRGSPAPAGGAEARRGEDGESSRGRRTERALGELGAERREEGLAELRAARAEAEEQRGRVAELEREKAGLERRAAEQAGERRELERVSSVRAGELERVLEQRTATVASLTGELVRLKAEAARWEAAAGEERRAAAAALGEVARARGTIAELERYLEDEALIREDQHRLLAAGRARGGPAPPRPPGPPPDARLEAAAAEAAASRAEVAALWSERAEWEARLVAVVKEAGTWQAEHERHTRELELEIAHLHAQLSAQQAQSTRSPPKERAPGGEPARSPHVPQPPKRLAKHNPRYPEASVDAKGSGATFVHYI